MNVSSNPYSVNLYSMSPGLSRSTQLGYHCYPAGFYTYIVKYNLPGGSHLSLILLSSLKHFII